MPEPTINDCKRLAYDLRKRGVLILTLSDGKVSGSSYGMTKIECRSMGRLLDRIVEKITTGAWEIEGFTEEPRCPQN